MGSIDFSNRIFLSVTGSDTIDWQKKLEEINELGITEVAVFLERFNEKEREFLYKFLKQSCIKSVPLVHLRHDVSIKEMRFFIDNYNTTHFNIHEDSFDILDKWKGYEDKLYLEMNFNDEIAKNVLVRKIGGFCIDLAHYKTAVARGTEEASYVYSRKNKIEFGCNHLNGFDEINKKDVHKITDLAQFDYLRDLPEFVFGKIIALEVENSIKEQIEFKKYLVELLNKKFNK